jgi:glutathione S-transferase
LHIAERNAGLLPDDANARARAIAMFAALNTVEPPIVDRSTAKLFEHEKSWYEERLTILDDRLRVRLGELSNRLGKADWLDGAFSAGDLLMVTVLRRWSGSGEVEKYSNLSAYVARGEARPAYKRAFDAQLAVFTSSPPKARCAMAAPQRPWMSLRVGLGSIPWLDPHPTCPHNSHSASL